MSPSRSRGSLLSHAMYNRSKSPGLYLVLTIGSSRRGEANAFHALVSTRSPLFGGLVVCVPEAIAGERALGECAIAFFDAANPQDAGGVCGVDVGWVANFRLGVRDCR
jgi:hypothetical protein